MILDDSNFLTILALFYTVKTQILLLMASSVLESLPSFNKG